MNKKRSSEYIKIKYIIKSCTDYRQLHKCLDLIYNKTRFTEFDDLIEMYNERNHKLNPYF